MVLNTAVRTSIGCRRRTRTTRCITANVLPSKVDAQCDKLATEQSWKRLRRSTFSSYSQSFVIANLTYPTCIWRLRWGDPGPRFEFCRYLRRQKTRVPRLSCGVACVILRLAVSLEHRLVTQLRHIPLYLRPLRTLNACCIAVKKNSHG